MVEGKTNHELAAELGFSVSTIRHETMRIYQALSVSDRKEAAKRRSCSAWYRQQHAQTLNTTFTPAYPID